MNDAQLAARGGHSVLSLQFEVVDDGQESFAAVAPGWRGSDLRSAKAATSQVSGPWRVKGRGALTLAPRTTPRPASRSADDGRACAKA
jgi:hypothetical protein